MGRFAHHQVKCAGLDLAESAIAIKRHRDRDRRIVPFKLHAACNKQIVKLIYVERFTGLAKQKRACLRDSPVRETMADRLNVCSDRRNPVLINVCNRIAAAVSTGDGIAARCGTMRSSHLLPYVVIVLDPRRFAQAQNSVAGTHRDEQAVDRRFGLRRAVLKRFDLLL